MASEVESGPLLRIAQVAQATGVPEVTLRAWERRYGIPTPTRTEGGYRLFGSHELEQVREMRRLTDHGVAASEAARIVRARETPARSEPRRGATEDAKDAILDAVVHFNPIALEHHLRKLLFRGPIVETLDEVIVPTLREVGDLWHCGAISIAHEHFASAQIGMIMRDFMRLVTPPSPRGTAVLACFEHDHHELGLLATAIRFGGWGLRSVVLGASTPPEGVRAAMAALDPALLALSCTVSPPARAVRQLLGGYAAAAGTTTWIVGGAAASSMLRPIEHLGGIVPRHTEDLHDVVDRCVGARPPGPSRAAEGRSGDGDGS